MRIVAGSRRGARLAPLAGRETRPTASRTRTAAFDLLDGGRFGQPYPGRLVVDGFAGTGALGLEALSRGADHAVFIESEPAALRVLARNIRSLGFEEQATVIAADATRLGTAASGVAGLVLLDPPYGSGLAAPCLAALRRCGWIGADTVVVIETARRYPVALPDWLELVDDRAHGAARLQVARPLPQACQPVLDQPARD
ncbi:MAG: RsmD family RNA methyltransferase [Alphaproteobacteria bacterium]|nr:RsmD family RNA methyltransferase [Alphaproteobacteria bacterium]